MEGVRGVISFAEGEYICAIQNNEECDESIEQHVSEILSGAYAKIMNLAKGTALSEKYWHSPAGKDSSGWGNLANTKNDFFPSSYAVEGFLF